MVLPLHNINIVDIVQIAYEAGKAILEVYDDDFTVEYKEDRSPLTEADKRANSLIVNALGKLTPDIPIVSEENERISYEERKRWPFFWMVDPLDGTKEFIKRNGEFTVNIALIEEYTPVLGVIYASVRQVFYFATKDYGAYKAELTQDSAEGLSLSELITEASRLPLAATKENFTIIGSRSHMSKETQDYIETMTQKHGEVDVIAAGSSLKLCLVAEGKADVYPRFAPTMEWDTAAGHMIAEEAGATVVDAKTRKSLRYNKEDLHNPWFLVAREDEARDWEPKDIKESI